MRGSIIDTVTLNSTNRDMTQAPSVETHKPVMMMKSMRNWRTRVETCWSGFSQGTNNGSILSKACIGHMRHWQLIWSKLGFYFSSGITLDIDVFFFGALPIDQSKIKHTKKLKEIPSRHFRENRPEKASMYAFIHLKLISNLQGFCQYIMADMLNLTIADYRKYSAVVFLGP